MPTIRKVSADTFLEKRTGRGMTETQRKRAKLGSKLRKALQGLDDKSDWS